MNQKMHNNLGHPASDKLGEHLQRLGFTQRMVEGAKDYHCQSCAERVPPKLTTPGKLKEAKEFNERIALDGFEWKGQKGNKYYYYVLHFFDESTHFRLGRRCIRNSDSTIKAVVETWRHRIHVGGVPFPLWFNGVFKLRGACCLLFLSCGWTHKLAALPRVDRCDCQDQVIV